MAEVWVTFPTANTDAANQTLAKWHMRGYRSCVLIDPGQAKPMADDVLVRDAGPYPGYPTASNAVIRRAVELGAVIVIAGNDDIDPDPEYSAQEIAARFERYFPDYFGVMQPTGDAYGSLAPDSQQRSCVSPWIGREFARRINGGHGVYRTEYQDLWDDAELWEVADRLGVLRQAPDIVQFHRHWSRGCGDHLPPALRQRICHSNQADMLTFQRRRNAGFPGYEPL